MKENEKKNGGPMKAPSGKRNSGPVRVLQQEDLVGCATLSQRMDAMTENRCEVFIHNVEFLCAREHLPQARLCSEKLGGLISPPQLTGYKQRGKDIPLRVMALVASAFNLTVEDICGQLLDEATEAGGDGIQGLSRSLEEYEKYLGTFDLTYFDTSAPLGQNSGSTEAELHRAVLTIYTTRSAIGTVHFHATAIFNCTVEERAKIAGYTNGVDYSRDAGEIREYYNRVIRDRLAMGPGSSDSREKYLYDGDIHLTENIMELTFRQVHGSGLIHLLAHNRAANSSSGKSYRGGLVTMMSVSRGAEHMPCMQAAILIRGTLARFGQGRQDREKNIPSCRLDYFAPEVLASKIYLAPPNIKLGEEINKIVSYMKFLFAQTDKDNSLSQLSQEDKIFCLETFAEKSLTEALRRNILSYYKLAVQMDSEVYGMIRQAQS